MKLIIDIPYHIYEMVTNTGTFGCYRFDTRKAIKNGTPLPKGHGDLIDKQVLIDNGIEKGFCDWYDEIKYADTIIEADMESEE